jgi:hypothetical protein
MALRFLARHSSASANSRCRSCRSAPVRVCHSAISAGKRLSRNSTMTRPKVWTSAVLSPAPMLYPVMGEIL